MVTVGAPEAEMKECFDFFDTDHDGKIKCSELGDVLRSLGVVLSEKDIAELKQDVSGDLVPWDKFKELAARKPRQPEKQAKAILQAFEVFDSGRSGQVDMQELQRILAATGDKMSATEFQEVCEVAQLPTSGTLEYRKVVDTIVGK
mmetsp:Transcript_109841/g.305574  ORF Transcript_109841/g.305574 Transcript_109841/m.305574 type:complete len:146 (-) Transcript_109841:130-567(-)